MASIPSTEISIVKINGKDFVTGLMWQPLSRPRSYMAEAREIGKRDKMDIVAIRKSVSMIQAGFVKKGNGVNKGMYSLASALSGQIQDESWIGAFLLPNGLYALVAVHRGLVVPGCDVVGDKQRIHSLLVEKDSQRKIMEFDKVFHPADFQHRGVPLDIEEVLTPKALRKEYALKPLTFGLTKQEIITLSCAAVAVLVLLVTYTQWQAYQAREAAAEAARQEALKQQRLKELSALAGAEQSVQALLHRWATQPGISDFLNGCHGAIDSLWLSVGGWPFEQAQCTSTAVEVVVERSGKTTFNDLIAAARERFPNPPVLMEGGDRARLDDEIKLGAGGDDELLPFADLQAEFTTHLQKLDLKANIVEVPVSPPAPAVLPGGESAPPPPAPDWRQFSFELTSPYTPEFIFSGLALQGVRLLEISVIRQGHQLSWSLKGEIYAR
ncbi:type 4b pilus protein PilO2 [Pseudomonas chlororaphis]|uniref:type 4b pilus protein PilO2 n=1 Tax=Pseudomonas chlororaphis TaxID=587753 RepID=UPI002D77E48B|nr:type 4b pilus protein PilO2 [Pseudomonas chlororaphis]